MWPNFDLSNLQIFYRTYYAMWYNIAVPEIRVNKGANWFLELGWKSRLIFQRNNLFILYLLSTRHRHAGVSMEFLRFSGQGAREPRARADMRYYADAVCVKNIRLCVKFMMEFTRLTRNVTIWEKSGTKSIPFGKNGLK